MKLLPPSGSRRRVLTLLIVLLVAVAGAWWWQSGPAETAALASNPGVRPAPATGGLALPEPLEFAALSAVDEAPEPGRNPFVFGVRPAPPPPPRPPEIERPAPPPLPPQPQGPPPILLRLTGVTVMPASGRMVVTLRDTASNTLFQAVEGEVVDGRYRVVKVGPQSVVVSYLDGSGQRTLILGG